MKQGEAMEIETINEAYQAALKQIATLKAENEILPMQAEIASLKNESNRMREALKAIVSTLEPFLTEDDDDPAVAAVELAEQALQTKEEAYL